MRGGAATWGSPRGELAGPGGAGCWFLLLTRGMMRGCLESWEWLELPFLQLRRCCTPLVLFSALPQGISPSTAQFAAELRFPGSLPWGPDSSTHPLASHLHGAIPQALQTQPTVLFAFPFTYTLHLDSLMSVNMRGAPSTYSLKPKPFPTYPHLVNYQVLPT